MTDLDALEELASSDPNPGPWDAWILELVARVRAAEAERDGLKQQLKFTHPVFNNATKGPFVVEPHGALPGDHDGVFRIVRVEDIQRFRDEYKTTARPDYIAIVWGEDNARLAAWTFDGYENTLRAYRAGLARIAELEAALVEARTGERQ